MLASSQDINIGQSPSFLPPDWLQRGQRVDVWRSSVRREVPAINGLLMACGVKRKSLQHLITHLTANFTAATKLRHLHSGVAKDMISCMSSPTSCSCLLLIAPVWVFLRRIDRGYSAAIQGIKVGGIERVGPSFSEKRCSDGAWEEQRRCRTPFYDSRALATAKFPDHSRELDCGLQPTCIDY